MIFPRTLRSRNVAFLAVVATTLAGCQGLPRAIPPNVAIPEAHAEGYVLDFSSDASMLVSGGVRSIRLWRVPEGVPVVRWRAHEGVLRGVAFIEDNRVILSVAEDATLARWDPTGRLLKRQTSSSPINDMALDRSGGRVFTAHDDGFVRAWSIADLSLLFEQKRHTGEVDTVAWHGPTRQLASSGDEGEVALSVENGPPQTLARPPLDPIDLTFSRDGRTLMGSTWLKLYRWALPEGSLQVLGTEHTGAIKSIEYVGDGRTLATISREFDSSVLIVDPTTGKTVTRLQPHDLCGAYVRLSPNGRYLATTADDASIRLWDLQRLLPPVSYGLSFDP